MPGRSFIAAALLLSLILACAISMGFSVGGVIAGGQATPAVPEDELARSVDQIEFGKTRLCELHSLPHVVGACQCIWHQLSIEATLLPEAFPRKTASPRGPPAV